MRSAPPSTAAAVAASEPGSLRAGSASPASAPMKDFRETPTPTGPELADPSETGQHGRVPLVPGETSTPEEADAGIHHDMLRGDPGLGGEMEADPKRLRHRLHG